MQRSHEFITRTLLRSLLVALGLALLAAPAWAAGGSTEKPAEDDKSPEKEAKSLYNQALEHRDMAWAMEEEGADPADVDAKFEKATNQLEKAVELDPELYQAWSSLGYAQRRLGHYEESLDAYDKALEIAPTYAEAVEYRAEAYLALGRLDEVKEAHVWLSNHDAERADELMQAIRTWLEDEAWKSMDDAPDAERIESFRRWADERSEMADATAFLRPAEGFHDAWGEATREE